MTFRYMSVSAKVAELQACLDGGSIKATKSQLKKLGKLEDEGLISPLTELLNHSNDDIRELTVKNLGKFSSRHDLFHIFQRVITEDSSSTVRREAVSSIGRQRNEKNISYLKELLKDDDPVVVMQAIRGLLVFKQQKDVVEALLELKNHVSETVRRVINIEMRDKSGENIAKGIHMSSPDYMKNTIVHGDALETLGKIKEEAFHLTFTSPPYYNARDYSIYKSYDEYLNFLKQIFAEVHRITKEGRFLIVNTSPVIMKRFARNHSSTRYPIPFDLHPILTKMGWEFIDDIVWAKPEASVKNRNGGFQQRKKPLMYKPNSRTEMVMVYRKKTHRLLDWNIKQYPKEIVEESLVQGAFESSNLWEIAPEFDRVHSAVFPKKLCDEVVKFYSMKGDLLFDPFGGSGTFGLAARRAGRSFFLTEINQEYFNRMKEVFHLKTITGGDAEREVRFVKLEDFNTKKSR